MKDDNLRLKTILYGGLIGMIVGLVITKGKVLPIIATLGLTNIFRGATYIVSNSAWVSAYQFQSAFKKFAQTNTLTFGLMNNLVFLALIVVYCVAMKYFERKQAKTDTEAQAQAPVSQAPGSCDFNDSHV